MHSVVCSVSCLLCILYCIRYTMRYIIYSISYIITHNTTTYVWCMMYDIPWAIVYSAQCIPCPCPSLLTNNLKQNHFYLRILFESFLFIIWSMFAVRCSSNDVRCPLHLLKNSVLHPSNLPQHGTQAGGRGWPGFCRVHVRNYCATKYAKPWHFNLNMI